MEYTVRRGEQTFGPYTLTELQEYFREGRLQSGDLAQSEGMSEWVPLSQILGNIPLPALAPSAPATPAEPLVALPPNLHWALLLLIIAVGQFRALNFLLAIFLWVWSLIIANWARKLINNNRPMVLVAMYPAGFLAAIVSMGIGAVSHNQGFIALGGLFILAGVIIYVFGIFKIRDAMEEYYNTRENIALSLSGVMTFFFSLVYLQFHINRIARWKNTGVLG
jgi:hypothetical protein